MPFNFDANSVRKLILHERMRLEDLESVSVKPQKIEDNKGGHWFLKGTIKVGGKTVALEIVSVPGKTFIEKTEDLEVINPKHAVLSSALFDQIQQELNAEAN